MCIPDSGGFWQPEGTTDPVFQGAERRGPVWALEREAPRYRSDKNRGRELHWGVCPHKRAAFAFPVEGPRLCVNEAPSHASIS